MTNILAIIGICGGLLCAIADCLLDLKGTKNQKLGTKKIIDSLWLTMPSWRFTASGIVAMFAVPMYCCGFVALMQKLAPTTPTVAKVLTITFLCGAMGGFMIHTFLCQMPTIYRKIMEKSSDFELAETTIYAVFRQIYVPFFTLYSLLVIVPSIAIVVLIFTQTLALPMWTIVLNPVVFQIVGWLLRATKCKIFVDAPGICAASLGLAMYGVLALIG